MNEQDFDNTIDWYDANAPEYSGKLKAATNAEAISDFIKNIDIAGSVLDAGCGDGRYTAEFARQGSEVVGLDLSEGLLEVARGSAPELEFIHGDFTKLPFEDQSFAGVWAHASLVHLPSIELVERSLMEFNRVLKIGGGLHIKVKEQTGENETEVISDSLSNSDRFFRYYSEEQLTILLEKYDFTVKDFYRENDMHGRGEVSWLVFFARKN